MAIKKVGTVIITSDEISFDGFHFSEPYTADDCYTEALQWLFERIMNDPVFLKAVAKTKSGTGLRELISTAQQEPPLCAQCGKPIIRIGCGCIHAEFDNTHVAVLHNEAQDAA